MNIFKKQFVYEMFERCMYVNQRCQHIAPFRLCLRLQSIRVSLFDIYMSGYNLWVNTQCIYADDDANTLRVHVVIDPLAIEIFQGRSQSKLPIG